MKRIDPGRRQRGAVLFIALVALIAMTLGALTLYRSVESATGVAGNIGFRQQGVAVTDIAIEAALNSIVTLADPTTHNPASGYYATQSFGLTNDDIRQFDWTANARDLGEVNGYRLWAVIHRMCNNTGTPTPGNCPDSGNTINQGSDKGGPKLSSGGIAPLYRITARAVGPRQSESIVQVITY